MKIFIVGLGLIGGSFALATRALYEDCQIFGIDISKENLSKSLSLGIIDEKSDYSKLSEADIVIVSVPVNAITKTLPKILDTVRDDTLVFDVGSSKYLICDIIKTHPKRRNFMATHPIAGTEFSGPDAAKMGLFNGKTMIICEVEKTASKIQKSGIRLFTEMGMKLRYMAPKAHDKHIAYVSHLSHISSFMLGKTIIDKEKNERDIFDMAGSGFESTVRLAKSPASMWTPIFEQNKDNVVEALEEYIKNLQFFKKLILADNFDMINDQMNITNKIREILNGIFEFSESENMNSFVQ